MKKLLKVTLLDGSIVNVNPRHSDYEAGELYQETWNDMGIVVRPYYRRIINKNIVIFCEEEDVNKEE